MNAQTFYIFSPTYVRACYLEGIITDSITGLPISGATVEIQPLTIIKTSDFAGEYRTGFADSGIYVVSYSKTNYNTKQINAELHNGVLTTLNVQLVPVVTGIENISQNTFTLFPNPSSTIICLNSNEFPVIKWQLTDDCGRIVKQSDSKFNSSKQFTIDISYLPVGIYNATLYGSTNKIEKTFVKN